MRLPLARSEALATEKLGDELLVYDLDTDRAHCLTPTAGRVWQRCDGTTRIGDIAAELGLETDEVARAVSELDDCELLASPTVGASGGLSRRDFGFKIAKVGAATAALPMILSIAAPAAAQTASHIATCRFLGTGNNCATCRAGSGTHNCCCCLALGGNAIGCAPDQNYCVNSIPGGLHCS